MITTKQRAYLRGLANPIDAAYQIGKNGINEAFIKQIDDALAKRELIKITVLENSEISAKEASATICEKLDCEGIQVIGRKFVIYRQAEDIKNRNIELPR